MLELHESSRQVLTCLRSETVRNDDFFNTTPQNELNISRSPSNYFNVWSEVLSSLKATFEPVHLCKKYELFWFLFILIHHYPHLSLSSSFLQFLSKHVIWYKRDMFDGSLLFRPMWVAMLFKSMLNLKFFEGLYLLSPPDPLVGNPLVAIEHRATLMVHPRVDAAIWPPGGP